MTGEEKRIIKALGNLAGNEYSIYRALHFVGDDDTKDAIESDLKEMLPAETFKIVQAIFLFYTLDQDEIDDIVGGV